MGKIILSSLLLLLVCAGISFADEDDEIRIVPINRKSVEAETAPDMPIPCAESEIIKSLNEPDSTKMRCFEISPEGAVTFNKKSSRMVKFEQKSSIVKMTCKADDDPEVKRSYLFILTKDRLSKLVSNSQLAVQINYENGKCFDITNTKQAAKTMPRMRVPAAEMK